MPPIRTIPPVSVHKTERSHAENQERAYIAASRRSDRSLEARVESARRASEIHKRRTGRSLRVTEQDVLNEEMYEEEDDLPRHYQRLAAQLYNGSAHLNTRLAGFLADRAAVRRAMAASMHQNQSHHAHPYPLNTSHQHHHHHHQVGSFQSPALPSPESLCSPMSYGSPPYPSSHFQAVPQEPDAEPLLSRPPPATVSHGTHQAIQDTQTPATPVEPPHAHCDPSYDSQGQPGNFPPQSRDHPGLFTYQMNPLNTDLPPASQHLLSPHFDVTPLSPVSASSCSYNYLPSTHSNYAWGVPLHFEPPTPRTSCSTALATSPGAATAVTPAPSHSTDTCSAPNVQAEHNCDSVLSPNDDFDDNSIGQEAKHEHEPLLSSAAASTSSESLSSSVPATCPQDATPQSQSICKEVAAGHFDMDQNPTIPDGGFWDFDDATWYHAEDLFLVANSGAGAGATIT